MYLCKKRRLHLIRMAFGTDVPPDPDNFSIRIDKKGIPFCSQKFLPNITFGLHASYAFRT